MSGPGPSPIFGFNTARGGIVDEVVRRVTNGVKDPAATLADATYQEIRRLSISAPGGAELASWRALARSLPRLTEEERRGRVEDLARDHAWDVAGNFDGRVYKFASKAVAPLIGALLAPRHTAKNISRAFDLRALDDRVIVQGPTAHLKKLAEKGTLIHVPTHLSNLDSVVFGFAIERAGLPPATYGAGKNLFTNPVLSYFMHNLGAYRVDRRLRHGLYKDVLKTYSCVLIERGYHSLFFPGGTRSRSGGVERRLKLGLAGTGLEAFVRTAEAGKTQPVYFVPSTINYLLTLEAETLIDDFLSEEGKHRFIIEDDESSRLGRVAAFMNKLAGLDAGTVIRFSAPVDCFGNAVDEDGVSHDPRGRPVDATSYIRGTADRVARDGRRDAQYTRELGDVICAAYKRDTVLMATHLVAASAFDHLRASVSGSGGGGGGDLFAMLRHRDDIVMPRAQLAADVERLRDRARLLEDKGEIVLADTVARASGETMVEAALRAFSGYHRSPVLEPRGTDLVLADTRLLFYYQNRLAAHGLAFDALAPKVKRAA